MFTWSGLSYKLFSSLTWVANKGHTLWLVVSPFIVISKICVLPLGLSFFLFLVEKTGSLILYSSSQSRFCLFYPYHCSLYLAFLVNWYIPFRWFFFFLRFYARLVLAIDTQYQNVSKPLVHTALMILILSFIIVTVKYRMQT